MKLNFIGGAKIGNLAFKISASGKTIDLNTKYGYFPISYGVELEFSKVSGQSSASFDIPPHKKQTINGIFHDDSCGVRVCRFGIDIPFNVRRWLQGQMKADAKNHRSYREISSVF